MDKKIKHNSIIRIVDIKGQLLFTQPVDNDKEEIQTTGLSKGFYFLQLLINNEIIEIKKLLNFKYCLNEKNYNHYFNYFNKNELFSSIINNR